MADYQSTGRSLELLSFTTAAIGRGDSYSAGELFQGVTAGNTKKVYVDNSGNDTDVVVLTPNVASDGQIYTNAVVNPTEDTQGDTATVQTVSTSGNGLNAAVRTAGDNETGVLSGGDAYPQVTIGGGNGGSGAAVGIGTNPAQIAAIVEAGDVWSVEASNESGNASDISITLTIAEVESNTV
jgi:hypothetical protein